MFLSLRRQRFVLCVEIIFSVTARNLSFPLFILCISLYISGVYLCMPFIDGLLLRTE